MKGRGDMREAVVKALINLISILPPYLCGCASKFVLLCLYNRRKPKNQNLPKPKREGGREKKNVGVTAFVFL